mgnify:CR=1 FL=1
MPSGPTSRAYDGAMTSDATDTPRLVWDAGELGCGDLVLALRGKIREVSPGAVLEVIARDGGAAEDVPSWCRLTGHALVGAAPPVYRIRRKTE